MSKSHTPQKLAAYVDKAGVFRIDASCTGCSELNSLCYADYYRMMEDYDYFFNYIIPSMKHFVFAPLKKSELHKGEFREELFKQVMKAMDTEDNADVYRKRWMD